MQVPLHNTTKTEKKQDYFKKRTKKNVSFTTNGTTQLFFDIFKKMFK